MLLHVRVLVHVKSIRAAQLHATVAAVLQNPLRHIQQQQYESSAVGDLRKSIFCSAAAESDLLACIEFLMSECLMGAALTNNYSSS